MPIELGKSPSLCRDARRPPMPRFRERRYTPEEIRDAQQRLCAGKHDLICEHNVWLSMADIELVGMTLVDVLIVIVVTFVFGLIMLGGAFGLVGVVF
jgi:hypothetical protein